MNIDLKLIALATIGKQTEKQLNNNEVKQAIRKGNAKFNNKSYCNYSLGKQSNKHYFKDNVEIKLDTTKIIENYCKENGIDIVEEKIENYKITFTPTQKAYTLYNTMLEIINNSTDNKQLLKLINNLQNL